MDYFQFFDRFGGSARTKNIRQMEVEDAENMAPHIEKPICRLPSESGLPLEFIRLCPWEMEFLFLIARRARVGILEIGRFNGGSTFVLACAAPHVPIHSIDISPQNDDILRKLFSSHGIGMNVNLIVGDSQNENHESVGAIDLLFIDGDHSYAGCMADIRNWYDRVTPLGKIVFHDSYIGRPFYGVQDAALDLLEEKRDELEVIVSPLIGAAHWRHPFGSIACLQKTR